MPPAAMPCRRSSPAHTRSRPVPPASRNSCRRKIDLAVGPALVFRHQRVLAAGGLHVRQHAAELSGLRAPGSRNWDLSLFKDFALRERLKLQFRSEAFNAFNRVRFGSPNTSVVSNQFGQISSQANSPRQIQFGLKLIW